MNCLNYLSLSDDEQRQYIGSLVHAVMSDDDLFSEGIKLIKKAGRKGKFDGVKIGSEIHETNLTTITESNGFGALVE
jgi:hypothetical protein